jgi:cytochrome c553
MHHARCLVTPAKTIIAITAVLAAWCTLAEEVTGDAVYKYCTSCHGERGAGGEGGKYPRIAGLPGSYVDKQLHDFKAQRRVNKPMIPIFKHHRFDDEVIATVSEHIAEMPPPGLALWPYEPDPEALAAFESRAAYDASGSEIYAERCAGCHGARAEGIADEGAPPLSDQYPTYLLKQITDFVAGRRSHAASEKCASVSPSEADAVIARVVDLGKR